MTSTWMTFHGLHGLTAVATLRYVQRVLKNAIGSSLHGLTAVATLRHIPGSRIPVIVVEVSIAGRLWPIAATAGRARRYGPG